MASDNSRVWTIMSLVAGLGAAALTRKLLDHSWKAASGKNPPENPADPDVSIGEAVLWAAITGAAVALARMVAQRRAANYYARSTGHLPPGLGKGDEA
jgi:Protein of unknown function (DUF4235)